MRIMKYHTIIRHYLLAILVLVGTHLFAPASYAEDFDIREYSLKAVFLERFTRFIAWPEEDLTENSIKPFVICVTGNLPFSELLQNIYQNQKIKDKTVIVQNINSTSAIKNCHMLFISRDSQLSLSEILKQTESLPVLTVSDIDGYARQGVMINFFISRKQKIRFEINEFSIKNSDLYISYKLLSVARIVEVN